jgi:hypothetical protein
MQPYNAHFGLFFLKYFYPMQTILKYLRFNFKLVLESCHFGIKYVLSIKL